MTMSFDGPLRLLQIPEQEYADAPASPGISRAGDRTLSIRLSGTSGAHVDLAVPASSISDGCTVRELLLTAIDGGHDDFDGTSDELGRRRILLQRLPDEIAGVTGGTGATHILMMHDDELGSRTVHLDAPVVVERRGTDNLHAHFVVAPYHIGGS